MKNSRHVNTVNLSVSDGHQSSQKNYKREENGRLGNRKTDLGVTILQKVKSEGLGGVIRTQATSSYNIVTKIWARLSVMTTDQSKRIVRSLTNDHTENLLKTIDNEVTSDFVSFFFDVAGKISN